MGKIITIALALYLISSLTNLQAQNIKYNEFVETFDTGNLPTDWSNEILSGTKNWEFKNGSYDAFNEPYQAYEGDYNAVFVFLDDITSKTKLVTPYLDFDGAIKPVLKFYHAQYFFEGWTGEGNTRLSIYYRAPELYSNSWQLLKTYPDSINEWTLNEILLPDTLEFTSQIQIGFEGWSTSNSESGTCLDSICIIETGIKQKTITANSISAVQTAQDIVPTGSENNPILRIKFDVKGNSGVLYLDSLGINALFDSESTVAENGVKLFATENQRFNDTTPIGAASSIVNGKAIFNTIQYDLPIGTSYLWITYDIPEDINHEFKGKILDASIDAYSFKINNEYLPSEDIDPYGFRSINESLFYDDFEGETLWETTGEFQIEKPIGLDIPDNPEPDPDYAQSGTNVLGTDLTGLGTFKGYYEKNLTTSSRYIATADTIINAKYYRDLKISYYRWLNLFVIDSATIELSKNNGDSWERIWANNSSINETSWAFKQINLSNYDRENNLSFRVTLGPTSNTPQSGWNIDNFALTGTFINDDAGFVSLISPSAGCGHVAPEPLEIVVQNYGYSTTNDTIPVGYSIDGDSLIMDTIFEAIPRDGTVNFTFNELIDLTEPGYHNIIVQTFYGPDEDNRNDKLDTTIYIPPTYTPPYAQSFENGNDFWRSFGENETWELGIPTDTTITHAYEGSRCWVTNLSGHYPDNDTAWIESPCFNFSDIEKPILECMLWADAETDEDGFALYYSLNEGTDWDLVPTDDVYSYDWDWYNNSLIPTLGSEGFDSVKNGWFKTRQILPAALAGKSVVKFKLLFISNETIGDAGIAIDNIKIYDAPTDAGVASIVSPGDDCFLDEAEEIVVRIHNYGIRNITDKDPLQASIDLDGETVLSETFYTVDSIDVGEFGDFTFTATLNMLNKGDYSLTAYTHIPGDTSFYIPDTPNDTASDIISVLGDPAYTLGPDIGTLNPDTVSLEINQTYTDVTLGNYDWWNVTDDVSAGSDAPVDVPAFTSGVTEILYAITVQNSDGCTMKDTIKVIESISDLSVTAATGTDSTCINDQGAQSLIITIQNNSADTIYEQNGILRAGYSIEGGEEHIEEFTILSPTIAENESEQFTFTTPPVFADSGNYNLKVYSVLYADTDYSNDTTYVPIRIHPLPEVNIGEDTVYTLSATTEIISFDATSDYFNDYEWQDGSSATTFNLSSDETFTYWVEVADSNGCGTFRDSVNIIANNWVVDSLISPQSNCSLEANQEFSFLLINNSPSTFPIGYELIAEITINGELKTDTNILTTPLGPTDSLDYIFNKTFDLSEPDDYTVLIKFLPEYDNNLSNKSLNEVIEVWGIYPVELGADTIFTQRADSIILNAGENYSSHIWSQIDTYGTSEIISANQELSIQDNYSYKYLIEVQSEKGCSNSKDSVQIMAYDIGIANILDPSSACELTNTDRIRFTLQNFGPDELPAGEEINLHYKIDEGSWIQKDHIILSTINSGQSSNIIIFEDIAFESTENYNMQMYVTWDKDYYSNNDSTITNIYQYPPIAVDLGEDIITTQADTILFDAGPGSTTYYWQDGSELQTFAVTNNFSDDYSVIVTNAFGCDDRDTVSVFTNDLALSTIGGNEISCASGLRNVIIQIDILGQDTILPGFTIEASYQLDNGALTSEDIILTDSLFASNPLQYTFAAQLNIPDTGDYKIITRIPPDIDANETNNIDSSFFRVGPTPVYLGEDFSTYESSIELNAGEGFDAYEWDDGSTESTRIVTETDTYSVTTTDVNGCPDSDEINVLFLNPAYEITTITGLADSCERFDEETISFTLLNTGNDTIFADSNILILYTLNTVDTIKEPYTFTSRLDPANDVIISFANTVDLSAPGAYIISAEAVIGTDTTKLGINVNTWGLPELDLGDDVKSVEESITLDAGAGHTSYLWSNNATTQEITVYENGTFDVTVTSSHGCENYDTVNVYFIPAALEIIEFMEPLNGCAPLSNKAPKIQIQNYGGRNIPAGTIINLGYQLEELERINENIELAGPLVPDAILTFPFNTTISIEDAGDADIHFYVNVENLDVDTADYIIEVYETPAFTFSGDTLYTAAYPYTIDPEVSAESYLWNTGETTPTLEVNSDNNYSLQVTNINACEFSNTVYVKKGNAPGVDMEWSNSISVYPNPTSEILNIEIPDIKGSTTIEIANTQGKIVYHNAYNDKTSQLNIENWSQGVYIIRIFNEDKLAIFNIIVQ